jgi:hypothetical protein
MGCRAFAMLALVNKDTAADSAPIQRAIEA